jgi:hypothetical protein
MMYDWLLQLVWVLDRYGFWIGMGGHRCSGRWFSSAYSLEASRFCKLPSGMALGRLFGARRFAALCMRD